tara:strand:- start:104 stop:247 length:144 start_codon:yes stop_codon:yes gene_type:complete
MAGNKYDIEYKKLQPKKYKLKYIGLYGDKTTLTGDARQIISHILNHI